MIKSELETAHEGRQGSDHVLDRTSAISVLRATALRLNDTRKRPRFKTRDLVGLLLSHSARAWRASLPNVRVKLTVKNPLGANAIRLALRPIE